MNFGRLRVACEGLANVRLSQIGLGRSDGQLVLAQGGDDLGATSRLIVGSPPTQLAPDNQNMIEIRCGKGLIEVRAAMLPNAIKVDVEGFELEVLQGLGVALSNPSLRVVGVEVHFGIPEQRGLEDAPRHIERLVVQNGFSIQWPDSSHLLALRS